MPLLARSAQESVGRYLATKTRYAQRLPIPNAPSLYATPDPPGYTAHSMWLLARHGTRWPTGDRMRQIDTLTSTFRDAGNGKAYPWIKTWVSPTKDLLSAAGELHPIGEDELWSLAQRLRQRFPSLVRSSYLPRRYPIVSTQVSRAAASANAFAAGFFAPRAPSVPLPGDAYGPAATLQPRRNPGAKLMELQRLVAALSGKTDSNDSAADLRRLQALAASWEGDDAFMDDINSVTGAARSCRPQAVAISMLPKANDPLLRFYDTCPAYAHREHELSSWLASWLANQWQAVVPRLEAQLGMTRPLGPCEVDALWSLCQFEGGVLGVTDRACALFGSADLALMEWLDDVNLLESHGWGSPVNYAIAAPLLQDLRGSLMLASSSEDAPHARLLFAHCETIVPLATLMGLFRPEHLPPSSNAPGTGVLSSSQQHGRRLQYGEGVDVCPSGREPPHDIPLPAGWFPATPNNDTRIFRGGRVSPYGANMVLVLYRAAGGDAAAKPGRPRHRVRLMYNEQVMAVPGCTPIGQPSAQDPAAHLDCDLDKFLAVTQRAAGGPGTLEKWCSGNGTQPNSAPAA